MHGTVQFISYGCSIQSMPRKREAPPRLTPLQLAVMQVLWSRDEASVVDVQRSMTGRRLALTTVATLLVRLEQRGLIHGRWVEKVGERRRRFYRITPAGRKYLNAQRRSWDALVEAIGRVTGKAHA